MDGSTIIEISNDYKQQPENIQRVQTFAINGATTTNNDNLFVCNTGTNADGKSEILSKKAIYYQAGQEFETQFTAKFTTGADNSTQASGLFSISENLGFGFDGSSFGIIHTHNGIAEIQALTITGPASGSTTVTIDDDVVICNVTTTTPQEVASEICEQLTNNTTTANKWIFEQIDDQIYMISRTVGVCNGVYSISGTTTGNFEQIETGKDAINSHVSQNQWNIKTSPFQAFDPTELNIYKIHINHNGVYKIQFYVYDFDWGNWEPVHQIKDFQGVTTNNFNTPAYQIGWQAENKGNTTNLSVEGANTFVKVAGDLTLPNTTTNSAIVTQTVNDVSTPLIQLKNSSIFGNNFNSSSITLTEVNIYNDHTEPTYIEIYKNIELSSGTNYNFANEHDSAVLVNVTTTVYSGGQLLTGFVIEANTSKTIEFTQPIKITPSENITLTANTKTGTATVTVTTRWNEEK